MTGPNMTDEIVDAVCDSLLMVYGLGDDTVHKRLSAARDQVRPTARLLIQELWENRIELVDLDAPTP